MTIWFLLVLVPAVPLAITLLNLVTWRRGRQTTEALSSVSVLIPARNEARNIGGAVESALLQERFGQSLVQEVLVYDDGSEDETAKIVRDLAFRDGRVRLIAGRALPEGWIGKPHACHRLAGEARGDLFLFIDADVRLLPGGVERLCSLLEPRVGGRVVSAVPAQITGSFFERLVMPLLTLTYASWLPLRMVEWGRDGRTVAANGQLLVLARRDYETLGGFASVRNEIVDDVAFCRHAKTSGLRVVFADGAEIATCRMYRSASETISGFSKNLHEGVGSTLGLIWVCVLYLLAFVAPYFALILALGGGESFALLLQPALVGVGLNTALRLALIVRFRQPWEGLILHPISVLALSAIAVNSWRWSRANRIVWAGRTYGARENRVVGRDEKKERNEAITSEVNA